MNQSADPLVEAPPSIHCPCIHSSVDPFIHSSVHEFPLFYLFHYMIHSFFHFFNNYIYQPFIHASFRFLHYCVNSSSMLRMVECYQFHFQLYSCIHTFFDTFIHVLILLCILSLLLFFRIMRAKLILRS